MLPAGSLLSLKRTHKYVWSPQNWSHELLCRPECSRNKCEAICWTSKAWLKQKRSMPANLHQESRFWKNLVEVQSCDAQKLQGTERGMTEIPLQLWETDKTTGNSYLKVHLHATQSSGYLILLTWFFFFLAWFLWNKILSFSWGFPDASGRCNQMVPTFIPFLFHTE